MTIANRVNTVAAAVLGRGVDWDSLRHLNLLLSLEKEFGVTFTSDELAKCDLATLVGRIERKLRSTAPPATKKVLVLDGDDTLWSGIVGEVGAEGIGANVDLQRWVKDLSARGVLLALATKNNPSDVDAAFLNAGMLLKLDDFAAVEAGWGRKSESLSRIAATLNLGLDSIVFVDDSPAERAEVAGSLPTVTVLDVPTEPAALSRHFPSGPATQDDLDRAGHYETERRRQAERPAFATEDEFLASLKMVGRVDDINDVTLPRVVQLLARANQCTQTTRRHSAATIGRMMKRQGTIAVTLHLRDRFGDMGLVGVAIAVQAWPGELRIDTLAMSCRVIGRGADRFLLATLMARAAHEGLRSLLGRYIRTERNAPARQLYPSMNFKPLERSWYRLQLGSGTATELQMQYSPYIRAV